MSADYKTLLGLVREFVRQCDHKDVDRGFPALFPDRSLLLEARAAIAPAPPKPINDPQILHMGVEDDCCAGPFQRTARTGAVDNVTEWECPKCGTKWKAERRENVRAWTPEVHIELFG